MYLWRRLATPQWWIDNEEILRAQFGDALAVIELAHRKRLQIEIVCDSPKALKEFGGRAKRLPRDWSKRFSQNQKTKPIKAGERRLIIPAGAAFGTGEHATTAMSLRMLERLIEFWGAHATRVPRCATRATPLLGSFRRVAENSTRGRVRSPELVVDLGTGSGILALAARCLGAKRVIGIDVDPIAIRIAKENALLNKIDKVKFQRADVRRWKFPRKSLLRRSGSGVQVDIVTANLFSELLLEILPKLTRSRWLILSGILRSQERDLVRALQRCKIDIVEVRRRGKWIAVLAQGVTASLIGGEKIMRRS